MRIIVKKRTIILALLCIAIGFTFAYRIYVTPKADSEPWTISKTSDNSKKFITKETLVTQIKQKQKLITTEVNLNEKITIDNSWGNLSILKKIQNINFIGTGLYVIDLSTINSNDITIDDNGISMKLPKPSVEMVTLNEEKTVFSPPEKGLLRFSDIKLSPEEHEQLTSVVKNKMKNKMLENQYYNIALNNSKESMKALIQSISDNNNNYNIGISFN
ncbi:DUF4230 domain-containing protein [Clostridium arbusti]|uniref:DUF4230 domain-containing protein n=1 Tax=Clostridium arbusti TaxID=1137848 RepID=UPI00028A103F|nr:DUF4230 domain-containing protein [Clostridium arbusti]